ncbi:MAG: DNA translocase FtsK [Tannerella sp.]|jgi:S-DNA-T family DNA segregation ATPase FtsK/SpoIIIE|nr:DNA translocase FtsK [Tannerella sp.]
MAKKKTKKKSQDENDIDSFLESTASFFTNDRMRFLCGLILNFLVIYTGIAMISFLFTGGADQSAIEYIPVGDLLSNRGQVSNWAGVWGAFLSDRLINRGFGLPTFFMLFFAGSAGFKMMGLCRLSFLRRFLLCSVMMLWASLFFAFAFTEHFGDTFLYLGGRNGNVLSDALIKNIGKPGVILLLFVAFLIIAMSLSRRVMPFLQKAFAFAWIRKIKLPANKKKNAHTGRAGATEPPEDSEAGDGDDDDIEEYVNDDDNDDDKGADEKKSGTPAKGEVVFNVTRGADSDDADGNRRDSADRDDVVASGDTGDSEADDEEYDPENLGKYDPRLDLSNYHFPPLELLRKYGSPENQINMEEQNENKQRIEQTLANFGISIISIKATVGPTLTLYEVVPTAGVRIAKIRNLEDDIALSLSALGIRIIAPMPGKGTIGIEVPNKDAQIVSMSSVIASRKFVESKYDLPIALGRTITNEIFMFDLCKMPHLLMAGATGQGKSVGLNAIITSLLYKKHPAELKFVLIDPKMVEFNIYEGVERHYLAKLPDEDKAIITDFTKVIHTLNSLCREMDERYELLTAAHVRNIKDYNEKFVSRRLNPEKGHKFMPYIVVIIDEFGDLIMTAGKDIEMPIARIAQKARAIGIHMIIATQRPSTNIITGTIKANFPARVAFRVSSMIDSRTILDSPGANRLIGRGDLLFSQGSEVTRVQCAFVDTPEVEDIANFISRQPGYSTAFRLPEYVPDGEEPSSSGADLSERDPLFDEAARLIVVQQQGSTSLIQRKFAIGYNRAGRLMDQLERAGIVGPAEGSKTRQVLVYDEYTLEQKLRNMK